MIDKANTIWLLRHAEPEGQGSGRFLGQRNVSLSACGREQAAAWRPVFARVPFSLVVSSDLSRCLQTADLALAGHSAPRLADAALREISLGRWEGLLPGEVEAAMPGAYAARGKALADYVPEGGESFRQVANRAGRALKKYALQAQRQGGPLLLVTHLGVCRALLCRALGMPLRNLPRIDLDYAHCALLEIHPNSRNIQNIRALNLPPEAV